MPHHRQHGQPARLVVVAGRPELHLDFLSEEHGVGHLAGGAELGMGDRLQVIPSHVCGCVNLFDVAYGVRGGQVERVPCGTAGL